jgi:hypothetical protein
LALSHGCGYLLGAAPGRDLMRPNDGAAIAAPLLLAPLLVPALRRQGRLRGRLSALVAGLMAGTLPWIIEAQLRFGGVRHRLTEAGEIQGGLRPVFSLKAHLAALDGPLLCRPCAGDSVQSPVVVWWVLLPLLAGLGLREVRRAHRSTAPLWLAVAVAVAASAPYIFLVPYAAARFLLPVHALLALPAALGVLAILHQVRTSGSRPATTALALITLGHLGVQAELVHAHAGIQQRARGDWARIASVLREHGVHPPLPHQGKQLGCSHRPYGPLLLRGNDHPRTPHRAHPSRTETAALGARLAAFPRTGHLQPGLDRPRTSMTVSSESHGPKWPILLSRSFLEVARIGTLVGVGCGTGTGHSDHGVATLLDHWRTCARAAIMVD